MQTQQVRGVATSVFAKNGETVVRCHQTAVVRFTAEKVVLDSGGWRTVTTKLRMNQASNQFGLGYQVCQKNFGWLVWFPGTDKTGMVFFDGMEIPR